MAKFDYMNFEGGKDTEFVAHAKKYTKEEVVDLCISENNWRFEGDYALNKPTVSNVVERQVKYFVNKPDYCGFDTDGGCYTFCEENAKGSFPVYVIQFEDLKVR